MATSQLHELPPPHQHKVGWPWTEETPTLPEKMLSGRAWPRISVVTPSFNQADYLEETIRSVLLQGYPNLEYFVFDGGSQDGSAEIIREYTPWLKSWASEPDRGQSHAINKGWSASTGDILAYLNSDDCYYPGTLKTIAELWDWDPSISVLVGAIAFIEPDSHRRREVPPYLKSQSPLDLSLLAPAQWFLPQQSTFLLRVPLDRVGRFVREDLHYTMDRELLYRICRQGRVVLTDCCLAGDRGHEQTKRNKNTIDMYNEDEIALSFCTWGGERERMRRKEIARMRRAQGHLRYAKNCASRREAIQHFFIAAFYQPTYLLRKGFIRSFLRSLGFIPS